MTNQTPLLNVVLFEPEIPQNTGNIGRTCVATGSKLWLVKPLGYELSDRYLRRAGLDYWQYLDYEVLEAMDAIWDRFQGRRMWFLSKKAKRNYTEVRYAQDDVLVFGKETKGLPEPLLEAHADFALQIPMMHHGVRSLNLATAVAICSYEVLRQVGYPSKAPQ